jgi:hypothetical protein
MGSFMSSALASGISFSSLNLYHNYDTLLSPANCCGVRTNQLPVTRNCGVLAIQLLATLKKTPSPLVLSTKLARKSEEKEGILKYPPPLFFPLFPVTLLEMVPSTVFRRVPNGFPPSSLNNPL